MTEDRKPRTLNAVREELGFPRFTFPEADVVTVPVPEPSVPACSGFWWVGQPLYSCDQCGRPAWEHDGERRTVEQSRGRSNVLAPWKPGEAEQIRAKWEWAWHYDRGCITHGPGVTVHGTKCPDPGSTIDPWAVPVDDPKMDDRAVERVRQILWARRRMETIEALMNDRLWDVISGNAVLTTTDLAYAGLLGNVSVQWLMTGEQTVEEKQGRFRARDMDEEVPEWATSR